MSTTAFPQRARLALRAAAALLTGIGTGIAALVFLVAWLLAGALSLVGIGLPLLPPLADATRRLTGWERRRLGRILGRLIPQHYRAERSGPRILADQATWRDLGWLLVAATAGTLLGCAVLYLVLGAVNAITAPFWWWLLSPGDPVTPLPGVAVTSWWRAALVPLIGLAYLVLLLWTPPLATVYARFGARVLSPAPSESLAERVDYLSRTRAEVLEAHGTELRRIERDLHDGLQARLVNANVYLGLMDQALPSGHPAREFAEPARSQVQAALADLRLVVRSIYPPILSDRGLAGALRSIAADSAVPCEVVAEAVGELPAAIEAAAYFGASEALANAVRHARPAQVRIVVERSPDVLVVRVSDDGVGGLEAVLRDGTAGTGLAGLRTRLRAFDGSFSVSSPEGGPTEVRMELPCAW